MANLTGKTISELPEDTSLSGSELFPVMDGATAKRVSYDLLQSQFFKLTGGASIEAGTNIDELLTPGTYYVYPAANITGGTPPPTNSTAYKLIVMRAYTLSGSPRLWQIAYSMDAACIECRRSYVNDTWGDWLKLDIGNVNNQLTALGGVSFTKFTIANGSSVTVPLTTASRGFILFTSPFENACGLYNYFVTSSDNTAKIRAVSAAANLALAGGVNSLTITSTSGAYSYALFINY